MKKLTLVISLTVLAALFAVKINAASVDSHGALISGPSTSMGTCSASLRGLIFNNEGGGAGGVVDSLHICRKLASGSYGWASVTTAP